jgi:hypothetical protein
MFGALGNIPAMIKQMRELRGKMDQLQADLTAQRHMAEAGGGAVRATVDGRGTLVDIRIDPEATKDIELLEDFIKSAVGLASSRAQENMKNEMAKLSGGIDLGGLSNMLGMGEQS